MNSSYGGELNDNLWHACRLSVNMNLTIHCYVKIFWSHPTPTPVRGRGDETVILESYEKKHADSGPPVGNKKIKRKQARTYVDPRELNIGSSINLS